MDRGRNKSKKGDGCMIKYVHTNIVAKDWEALARFYVEVFGCRPLMPERDLAGKWLDRLTGINGAHIWGVHLALPGYEEGQGPTLEIFQYNTDTGGTAPAIDRPGYAHIAFAVDDVQACVEDMIAHGGGLLGDIVETQVGERTLTVAYAKDIEGNLVEVQKWE
jgi:predicted enzyme related to lactoylglutathione lyase